MQGRVGNSAQRFPELNASLPKGRSAGSRWKLSTTLSMNRVGNSAQRFPELNASLPKGALQGRVGNSAQRSL
ncbi:hypothetical protein [Leptospira noguchii]|uniref:Uncharacterized protein n=1 Tax=Leptospira noguchii TaxID=28182 RepID=A0AAE9GIS7_9LEPT|nr:hypothetical protein [Leptospira noguchii]UOG58376.1 hypothetical protein MAL03_15080 [Leptospira noguchii]